MTNGVVNAKKRQNKNHYQPNDENDMLDIVFLIFLIIVGLCIKY